MTRSTLRRAGARVRRRRLRCGRAWHRLGQERARLLASRGPRRPLRCAGLSSGVAQLQRPHHGRPDPRHRSADRRLRRGRFRALRRASRPSAPAAGNAGAAEPEAHGRRRSRKGTQTSARARPAGTSVRLPIREISRHAAGAGGDREARGAAGGTSSPSRASRGRRVSGCVCTPTIRRRPPQRGHRRTSHANTRLSSAAHTSCPGSVSAGGDEPVRGSAGSLAPPSTRRLTGALRGARNDQRAPRRMRREHSVISKQVGAEGMK